MNTITLGNVTVKCLNPEMLSEASALADKLQNCYAVKTTIKNERLFYYDEDSNNYSTEQANEILNTEYITGIVLDEYTRTITWQQDNVKMQARMRDIVIEDIALVECNITGADPIRLAVRPHAMVLVYDDGVLAIKRLDNEGVYAEMQIDDDTDSIEILEYDEEPYYLHSIDISELLNK